MSSPAYVLIHGGGASARFWDRLLPHLDAPALAVNLPGRADRPADLSDLSVDDEVASVVADVRAAGGSGPVVVVAHSSGGLVVPGVVARLDGRVAAVVLSAALVPPPGGCGIDCMAPRHRDGLRAAVAQAQADGRSVTLPGPPPDPEAFRTAYGTDPLDDDTLAYMVDPVRCVPDTVHHYFQPVDWAPVAGVPITYLIHRRDRPVAPDAQEEMAARLPPPVEVVRWDCGHLAPVTEAPAFAALLAAARRRAVAA